MWIHKYSFLFTFAKEEKLSILEKFSEITVEGWSVMHVGRTEVKLNT